MNTIGGHVSLSHVTVGVKRVVTGVKVHSTPHVHTQVGYCIERLRKKISLSYILHSEMALEEDQVQQMTAALSTTIER